MPPPPSTGEMESHPIIVDPTLAGPIWPQTSRTNFGVAPSFHHHQHQQQQQQQQHEVMVVEHCGVKVPPLTTPTLSFQQQQQQQQQQENSSSNIFSNLRHKVMEINS
jgi:hypothetical protein